MAELEIEINSNGENKMRLLGESKAGIICKKSFYTENAIHQRSELNGTNGKMAR